MVRSVLIFETMESQDPSQPCYAEDHPINQNRILRVEEQLRELRADHGTYVSEAYDPNGDKIAAREHDIDYHLLVLSTNVPAPLPDTAAKTQPGVKPATITETHQ